MTVITDNLRFLLMGAYPEGTAGGLLLTLILSALVGVGALFIGVTLAAVTASPSPLARAIGQGVSNAVRGLPSLVFLFWMYFLLPALLHVEMTPLQSAAITLSIYHGAYIAEDIRGGLRAVGSGQWEAGRATGLDQWRIFWHIVLPQALRAMIPALVNRYINMFLYTSVASVVGVLEFTRAAILVSNRVLVHPIEIFGFAALVYFIFCYSISILGVHLERRWDWAPKIAQGSVAI